MRQTPILQPLRLVPDSARAVQRGLHEGIPVHTIVAHAWWDWDIDSLAARST